MYNYAQIDEAGVCIAVSQLSGEVEAENLILLEAFEADLLGKTYLDGTWV